MMIKRPNILMIGAAGRNVGKTEFACRLIARYAARNLVIGVKVTTIKERGGRCPRGGDGCGVCSSLTENYCITTEPPNLKGKDTARMGQAGAESVYWLRVLEDHLEQGVADLLQRLPEEAVVVMESNSARGVLEPGVFLVVRETNASAKKPSCDAVMDQADRVLTFNGSDWDLQPQQCVFVEGRWSLVEPAGAIILAGGQSRRMGQDKSLLPVEGVPMIQHIARLLRELFDAILIGANDPSKYAFLPIPVIPDGVPGQGPLMGIVSCLEQAQYDVNLVVGCDIPRIDLGFVESLLVQARDADIVVPVTERGYEPLLAVYRKSVIIPARRVLAAGQRRITAVFDHVRVKTIPMEPCAWYRNLNTFSDYQQTIKDCS